MNGKSREFFLEEEREPTKISPSQGILGERMISEEDFTITRKYGGINLRTGVCSGRRGADW